MEEVIKNIPLNVILSILSDKLGIPVEYVFNAKADASWCDIGLDDLDTVELVMEIEKEQNIFISDELANKYFDTNSKINLIFKSLVREQQIDKILK